MRRQKQRNDNKNKKGIVVQYERALSVVMVKSGDRTGLWPLSDEEDRLMWQCGDHGAGIGASSMGSS